MPDHALSFGDLNAQAAKSYFAEVLFRLAGADHRYFREEYIELQGSFRIRCG